VFRQPLICRLVCHCSASRYVFSVQGAARRGLIAPEGAIDGSPGRSALGTGRSRMTKPRQGRHNVAPRYYRPYGAPYPTSRHFPGLTSWANVLRPSGTKAQTLNKYVSSVEFRGLDKHGSQSSGTRSEFSTIHKTTCDDAQDDSRSPRRTSVRTPSALCNE